MSTSMGITLRAGTGSPPALATSHTKRRVVTVCWLVLGVGLLLVHLYPIRFATLRLALAGGALLWWLLALCLVWPLKPLRYGGLGLSAVVLSLLILPGRATDSSALRAAYMGQLTSYTSTPYVWGGESRRGIDCSGLMRCPLIDATLQRGIWTANPSLVRTGLALWWRDASARELKAGYGGRTQPLFEVSALNALTPAQLAQLQPGDMAVTANGVHVLAYLGNKRWIEADPSAANGDSVIQVALPSKIAWFNTRVQLVRWRHFQENP